MSSSSTPWAAAGKLARILVAGPWRQEDLVDRGAKALGRKTRWLSPMVRRALATLGTETRPSSSRLTTFLYHDRGFLRAWERDDLDFADEDGVFAELPAVMWPSAGAPGSWSVPAIVTTDELAGLLTMSPARLRWMADPHARERQAPGRYLYRWVAKRSGTSRLLEIPGERLRGVQRWILREILACVSPHDAAHGFRPGRSIRSFAGPHVGRRVVLKMDLRDFFPTVSVARVAAIFLTLGYPEPVARLLAGLCTNSVPSRAWDSPAAPRSGEPAWRTRRLLQRPHLPQGAPSSPALANLAAFRLDMRLSGLAESAGAIYTRYADDLAFSGDREFEKGVDRFHVHACAIAIEEGFPVQTRKTRVMRQGVRQQVAGVVVNERLNSDRGEFDRLKATLHNCERHGPALQNRDGRDDFRAHLLGRIAHQRSLNPDRGQRLLRVFERIVWPNGA